MKTYLPPFAFGFTAITFTGFAIWLGASPQALLETFGVKDASPQMLTEVRAFYGGLEFGIAAAMTLLWFRGERFASLLVGAFPLGGAAAGRFAGMAVDGYSSLHFAFGSAEAAGSFLCLMGCCALHSIQNKQESETDG